MAFFDGFMSMLTVISRNTGGYTTILAPYYRIIPPPAFFDMSFAGDPIHAMKGAVGEKYDFTVDNRTTMECVFYSQQRRC